MNRKWIEWLGFFFGIMGAALVASNSPYSGWGFLSFLGANLCWGIFAIRAKSVPLLLVQSCYTVTSLFGIYRFFIVGPKVLLS